MSPTKTLRETVRARAERDPDFRAGLYQEAVQVMLDGDFATGRILLRDFINATIGFAALAGRVGISDKSLMRMFGPANNPHAENLLAVLAALRDEFQLNVAVELRKGRRTRGGALRKAA